MHPVGKETPAKLLKKLPMRLHHNAYTTEDHELNRQFYEDLLGLPLVAMYVERELIAGEWVVLGHAFYELGDGSALAFFNFSDPAKQAAFTKRYDELMTDPGELRAVVARGAIRASEVAGEVYRRAANAIGLI